MILFHAPCYISVPRLLSQLTWIHGTQDSGVLIAHVAGGSCNQSRREYGGAQCHSCTDGCIATIPQEEASAQGSSFYVGRFMVQYQQSNEFHPPVFLKGGNAHYCCLLQVRCSTLICPFLYSVHVRVLLYLLVHPLQR